uniref:diguanylate cyclase n=3 Tax=Aliarcobacter sp. TaxID=2321116 RepID=UPI004047F794
MNSLFKSIFVYIVFIFTAFADNIPLEKVTLQLHWKHQFEFAGYFMAKEKGFYKDVGIDVDILEYHNGINIAETVIKNEHTFAIGYSSTILDEINTNKIVLLSANFQSSPHVLVSLKSSNINSIRDFKNKKIMVGSEERKSAAFISMLQANGVSFDDMIIEEPSFKVEHLIDGTIDLASYFYTNETYTLDKKAIPYNIWNPKDYGFDFYSDILFTSKKELEKYPVLVENFRAASLRGWKYAFDHIDETTEVILQKYNSQNKTQGELLYEARGLKELAYKENIPLGTIQRDKVQRIIDIYTLLGLYKNNTNIDELIYKESNKFYLTPIEKEYLKKKNIIKMCVDPDWMPFEKIEKEQHIGMAADYFNIIKKTTNLNVQLVKTNTWSESLEFAKQRKCDILSFLMATPDRKKYLDFTSSYLKIPVVMATKTDVPFINDFNSLKGKKIGIPKGYAFIEILKVDYPDLTIVEVDNIDDGLKKVVQGELYGYIGTLATIGYSFQKKFTGELKISGKFDGTWDFSVGVRNDEPILLNIFQKAVDSIDKEFEQEILNKWLAINYIKEIDYSLVFKVIGIFILILLIVLFFYLKQMKLKMQLKLLSITDSMTKLYNRRYFEETANNYFELAKRNESVVSLLMLDVDNFKHVNDTYGHKVGDIVLIELSNLLQNLTRKSDIVCRFGGEEFIILLSQTNIDTANIIAEKIRANIENHAIKLDKLNHLNITVSIGVSQVNILTDKNIEDCIKRSDDALYKAKNSGKNKVILKENLC